MENISVPLNIYRNGDLEDYLKLNKKQEELSEEYKEVNSKMTIMIRKARGTLNNCIDYDSARNARYAKELVEESEKIYKYASDIDKVKWKRDVVRGELKRIKDKKM